jgi:hypothetical protein
MLVLLLTGFVKLSTWDDPHPNDNADEAQEN